MIWILCWMLSEEAWKKTEKAAHENPLLVGVTALFAGMITGLLLPVSETEKNTIGKRVNNLFERAQKTGEQALQTGKEIAKTASEVANVAKEEAGKQGEKLSQAAKGPGTPQEKASDLGTKAAESAKATTEKAEEKLRDEQQKGRKAA